MIPWMEIIILEELTQVVHIISEYGVKGIPGVTLLVLYVGIDIYVLIDDVVCKHNLFESLRPSHNNLSCAENAHRDLFHVLCRFEFYFHRGVSVGIKTCVEDLLTIEMIRHLHKIHFMV